MSKRREWVLPVVSVATIVLAIAVVVVFVIAQRSPSGRVVGVGSLAPPTAASQSPRTPYVCWNGVGADALVDCSDPRDAAGLDWVFPDRHKADVVGSCANAPAPPRDLLIECALEWRGQQVYLHYGYFGRWTDGQASYDAGGATPLVRQRSDGATWLYWRPRKEHLGSGGVTWRTAQMIGGKGWTVAAYAPDQSVAEAALDAFGRIRDLREWRGLMR